MTKWTLATIAVAALLPVMWLLAATAPGARAQENGAEEAEKRLRHIVLFQFKETASPEDVQKVVDAFAALPQKIDTIAEFEYGKENSPEGLAEGFTHCFMVTFRSEEDRAAYLPHPAHKAFVEILKPHLEKVLVVDYWATM